MRLINNCVLLLCFVALFVTDGIESRSRGSRSSSRYSYSRYSYGYRATSALRYSRYSYRYSSSSDTYRASSISYTPTTYSYSYSYYTRLYYSYYSYTYYSYYYRSTCTMTSTGSSCSSPTTTAAPTTTAPAAITCPSSATLISSSGSFDSHNAYGSRAYTTYMSCGWTITAGAGYRIRLSFISFSTEKNYDKVYVYDGTNSSATLLGTYHGASSSDTAYPGTTAIFSTGTSMHVRFTSDFSVNKDGFRAIYQQVSSGSLPPTVPTTAASVVTTASSSSVTYCDGEMPYTQTLVSHSSNDGLLLPSTTGAAGGLGNYRDRMNCTWRLPSQSGFHIQLQVMYMYLENCYDKVSIYQNGSASPLRVYCDATTPYGSDATITIPANTSAVVTFTSDGSGTRGGFLISAPYISESAFASSVGTIDSSSAPSTGYSDRTNNVCFNYQVNANGTAMGPFTCPNPFEPADFTQCCGEVDKQYCCRLKDNTPMIVGIVVGVLCLLIVLGVIIFCFARSCGETAATKSQSNVKWRRSVNKARAITAWKRMGAMGGGGAASSAAAAAATSYNSPASAAVEEPTFTPAPVPPPTVLYGGGGYQFQHGPGAAMPPPPQMGYNNPAYPPPAPYGV